RDRPCPRHQSAAADPRRGDRRARAPRARGDLARARDAAQRRPRDDRDRQVRRTAGRDRRPPRHRREGTRRVARQLADARRRSHALASPSRRVSALPLSHVAPRRSTMTTRLAAPLLLAASLLASCGTQVVNPVTGQTERTAMDEASEMTEGAKAHKDVLKEYGAVDDAKLQAYVNELGQRLAAQSHRPSLPWTFTVLDSPEINAFALPGGYVYVTRGIMAYLENEAELAGVMGHEIGHVTARHAAQRATRQQNAGIGVIAATVLGAVLEVGGLSGATNIASQASQSVAAGYVAAYSRDQESQADELGAEYLSRNRYDPRNMIDVIQVLKNQEQF